MTSLSLKEYADETDIRLREANKLRIDARTLTKWELIDNNPRINEHIISNIWHSVNDIIDLKDKVKHLLLVGV
jgi:hypothetical protein|tara:strand:+ start:337 stop:555 length:219 start_codon:yes stop_codon:yes gene_type:complete